jgi:hypothetical protein
VPERRAALAAWEGQRLRVRADRPPERLLDRVLGLLGG